MLVALALSGCGGPVTTSAQEKPKASPSSTTPTSTTPSPSASAPSSSPDPAPRSGNTRHIEGTGYAFTAPVGWRDVTEKLKGTSLGVDRAAASTRPMGGFADNVNVVIAGGGQATPAQLDAAAQQIKQAMRASAPAYRILPRTSVAGTPAAHLAGMRTQGKTRYWLEQYVVVRSEAGYVISFSFSPVTPPARRQQLVRAILAHWSWR